MTRRFLVAAVLAIGLSALPAFAQGPGQGIGAPGRGGRGGPGGPGFGPGFMPMLQQLDLSDQQREQIRSLMEANRPTSDPGQLRAAELKLHAAILGDNPDQQAIDAARTTINAAHAAELDHQIDILAKVAQILTPDQRQQLLKLQSEGPRGRGRGF
jgi:Spy/CpxP family protein refolding chaperone